jgi:hypothetical protein
LNTKLASAAVKGALDAVQGLQHRDADPLARLFVRPSGRDAQLAAGVEGDWKVQEWKVLRSTRGEALGRGCLGLGKPQLPGQPRGLHPRCLRDKEQSVGAPSNERRTWWLGAQKGGSKRAGC